MRKLLSVLLLLLYISAATAQTKDADHVDVCIYGGTSAGVIAAYTAAMSGKKVLLIEPGKHLGGMSSGGLGYTDIGNKYVVTGLARDFYRKIGQHYHTFEQWIFEPKVAEGLFNDYIKKARVPVLYEHRLLHVQQAGNHINSIQVERVSVAGSSRRITAKVFIDCSYEGDLMAGARVSYTVGREDNKKYNETFNGVQLLDGHQLPDGIDPYVQPGDSTSGLLWGINAGFPSPDGSGDKKVQAYNFRIALTNVPGNRLPITRPDNYNVARYELLLRLMNKHPWTSLKDGFIWSLMPNGKTDINNRNGFSTDMIGMNWDYPEGSYTVRAKIWQEHTDYTKGLLYFLGHDERVAPAIRKEMLEWGYPADEYTDNDHWSHQLYIREARRMIGELVMTQHHCEGREVVTDPIAMAAYTMDSHNCDRQVINGMVKNEGNIEKGGFGPYPVSYRAIIPRASEADNLLVPVCMSASHIAYGSIRMEPVFMVMAQSAAVAACMAIDERVPVQQVRVDRLRELLRVNPLMDGSVPEILVDNNDTAHVRINGEWAKAKHGGYGPDFLTGRTTDQPGSVIFTPDIIHAGTYNVYGYFPVLGAAAPETVIRMFDGKRMQQKKINRAAMRVQGQSGGGWVLLDTQTLKKGKAAFVEITNAGTEGVVAADAILFVPVKK